MDVPLLIKSFILFIIIAMFLPLRLFEFFNIFCQDSPLKMIKVEKCQQQNQFEMFDLNCFEVFFTRYTFTLVTSSQQNMFLFMLHSFLQLITLFLWFKQNIQIRSLDLVKLVLIKDCKKVKPDIPFFSVCCSVDGCSHSATDFLYIRCAGSNCPDNTSRGLFWV